MGVSTPGLADVGCAGTGCNQMPSLAAVGAQTRVRPTPTFLHGKRASGTPGTIQIHGGMVRGGWPARGGRGEAGREGTGRLGLLLMVLGAGVVGSSLVVLHRNGGGNIGRESGRKRTPRGKFKPNCLL